MPEDILPPEDDDVKFQAVTMRLSPGQVAKIKILEQKTGLPRKQVLTTVLSTAFAALTGDNSTLTKWQQYADTLHKNKKTT